MEQPRTSIVFQAHVQMPDQRNSDVADEERRLHILQSMAKLEGSSKPVMAQASPKKKVHYLPTPAPTRHKAQPNPHQYALAPYLSGPQSFASVPLSAPYFYYPSFAPNNVAIFQSPMMAYPMYHQPMPSGSRVSKNSTLPSQEIRKTDPNFAGSNHTSTLPASPRQYPSNNETVRTPERSSRVRSFIPSLVSSPESNLQTPSPTNSYNPGRNQQTQYQQPLNAEPLETRQPRHSDRHQTHMQSRDDNTWTRTPIEGQSYPNASVKKINANYENLIKAGNYSLQLESKKTGEKLAEKKRLTTNELKLLEALPPLPPRPELQRHSLSSSSNFSSATKKKKQDKFAWLDY